MCLVCVNQKKLRNFVMIIKTKNLDCWNLLKQYILENLEGGNEKRPKKIAFGGFGCLSLQIETTFFFKMSKMKIQKFSIRGFFSLRSQFFFKLKTKNFAIPPPTRLQHRIFRKRIWNLPHSSFVSKYYFHETGKKYNNKNIYNV